MMHMAKMKKYSITLEEKIMKKAEAAAKVEGKGRDSFINEILKDKLDSIIEERGLDKKALNDFIEDKLSFEELAQIIGYEKARAARITKRIGVKGKELLKSI